MTSPPETTADAIDTKIDAAFITKWAGVYVDNMKASEVRLLDVVGPAVAERGYYTKGELHDVGRWKANRATGHLDKNSDDDVRDITRIALAAPLRLRHRVLSLLHGVGRPMASALLTVWRPEEHTILDVNAVNALHHFGKLTSARVADVSYVDYLMVCRSIVDEIGHGVELRDLDRALWKWWDQSKG